jgi:hypothetical protein
LNRLKGSGPSAAAARNAIAHIDKEYLEGVGLERRGSTLFI